jgi:hypothetical protein
MKKINKNKRSKFIIQKNYKYGAHWSICCNIKTLNTLLRGLKERHWCQSDAVPGGPFRDVRGHKRLLEKERLASLSITNIGRFPSSYFNQVGNTEN